MNRKYLRVLCAGAVIAFAVLLAGRSAHADDGASRFSARELKDDQGTVIGYDCSFACPKEKNDEKCCQVIAAS